MENIHITLTMAGKLSRLNGYTNASQFIKDLSKHVAVYIEYESTKVVLEFRDGEFIGRTPKKG